MYTYLQKSFPFQNLIKFSTMKRALFCSLILITALFFVACKHDASASKLPAATADSKNVKYQCPMDCEKGKVYDQPGQCPVCKMDLAAVEAPNAAAPKTYKVMYTSDPAAPAAGKSLKMTFTPAIVEKPGEVVPLDLIHEKKMHLIMVSSDLSWFDHQHPEYNGTGLDLTYSFPKGGEYLLFADYTPAGGGNQVEKIPVAVSGTPAKALAFNTPQTTVKVDGYEVTLSTADGKWLTNNEMHITGTVKQGGKVLDVNAFENYLGAKAHVVMVGLADKNYEHVHPGIAGSTFDLQTEFKTTGIYRVWLQFQTQGKVHTADFVLKVEVGKPGEVVRPEGHGGHDHQEGEKDHSGH